MFANRRTSLFLGAGVLTWICASLLSQPAAAPRTGLPDESLAAATRVRDYRVKIEHDVARSVWPARRSLLARRAAA